MMIAFDLIKDRILRDGYFDINDIESSINNYEDGNELEHNELNIYENELDCLDDKIFRNSLPSI